MGGRLSVPKAADGISEAPKPASANGPRLSRNRGIINGRVRRLSGTWVRLRHLL